MIRKFVLLMLLMATLGSSSGHAQQPIDGIAAVVGKQIILISDINTMITQYAMQNRVNPFQDPAMLDKLSKEFLSRMIDEKLLLIKAEEDTILADEERVEEVMGQQISGFIQQAGSQEALEEYYDMPLAQIRKEFRKRIGNQMIIEQLRNRKFQNVNVSRREVEAFFVQYRDSLPRVEESVDISHILRQIKPSETSASEAYEKISRIKTMLEEGQDFSKLAERSSEDPSAKINKGNLGLTSRGDFVKEFEEAAYALEVGQISDIIQTQFGYHIIQLLNRQGDKINAQHILIQLQPTQDDERLVVERLQEIRRQILNGEETFEEMALKDSDDPNVQTDRGNLGEFAVNNFQVKAFEETVKSMTVDDISKPVRTEFGYHIIRLNKRIPARSFTLKNDWQRIESFATDYKRNQQFQVWLKSLRDDIPVEVKIQI